MQIRYSTDDGCAEAGGFDHPSAVFGLWGIVAGVFPWVVVPALFVAVLACTLGAALVVFALALLLQYRVRVLPEQVIVERSWAGVRYKRVVLQNAAELEFIVSGTGDHGDEGMWPAKHYCEIVSPGQSDLLLGTPGRAEELALWLSSQARRVVRT